MRESEVRKSVCHGLDEPGLSARTLSVRQSKAFFVTYRTDPVQLRALVPEPLEPDGALVKYEFIRMPGSTGFGHNRSW